MSATSGGVVVDRGIRRRWLAVAMEGQPTQVVVEQVRRDVADRPERAGGRPVPVVGAQPAQEPDEPGVERREPVDEQHGLERPE